MATYVQAKQMLREADLNGDGKVSKSEFDELLKVGGSLATGSLGFFCC